MRHSLKYVAQEDRLEFMGKLVRCGMKKYRVIARRPFGADVAISWVGAYSALGSLSEGVSQSL